MATVPFNFGILRSKQPRFLSQYHDITQGVTARVTFQSMALWPYQHWKNKKLLEKKHNNSNNNNNNLPNPGGTHESVKPTHGTLTDLADQKRLAPRRLGVFLLFKGCHRSRRHNPRIIIISIFCICIYIYIFKQYIYIFFSMDGNGETLVFSFVMIWSRIPLKHT